MAYLDGLLKLPDDHVYSEAEVIELLSAQIADLLEHKRDWLLGKLYRLDVREVDIKKALANTQHAVPAALARLILARQAERLQVRQHYQQKHRAPPDYENEDLAW